MNFRRILAGLLLTTIVLPVVMVVVSVVARLLAAMADASGAAVLDRVVLGLSVLWAAGLVLLVVAQGLHLLGPPPRPPRDRPE